jgi:hypothetical protein
MTRARKRERLEERDLGRDRQRVRRGRRHSEVYLAVGASHRKALICVSLEIAPGVE